MSLKTPPCCGTCHFWDRKVPHTVENRRCYFPIHSLPASVPGYRTIEQAQARVRMRAIDGQDCKCWMLNTGDHK